MRARRFPHSRSRKNGAHYYVFQLYAVEARGISSINIATRPDSSKQFAGLVSWPLRRLSGMESGIPCLRCSDLQYWVLHAMETPMRVLGVSKRLMKHSTHVVIERAPRRRSKHEPPKVQYNNEESEQGRKRSHGSKDKREPKLYK